MESSDTKRYRAVIIRTDPVRIARMRFALNVYSSEKCDTFSNPI